MSQTVASRRPRELFSTQKYESFKCRSSWRKKFHQNSYTFFSVSSLRRSKSLPKVSRKSPTERTTDRLNIICRGKKKSEVKEGKKNSCSSASARNDVNRTTDDGNETNHVLFSLASNINYFLFGCSIFYSYGMLRTREETLKYIFRKTFQKNVY